MHTNFTQEQQANFDHYFEIQRSVEMELTGRLSEQDLTMAQQEALNVYINAKKTFYIEKWGGLPRGSVLREESKAEFDARLLWEESLKTEDEKTIERLEQAIYETSASVSIEYLDLDTEEEHDDALHYFARVLDGNERNNIVLDYKLLVHQDYIEILQICCYEIHFDWNFYKIMHRPAEIIAEMKKEWST